jgi:hypothetical protein
METLDEVVDDLSAVMDGRDRKLLSDALTPYALLIDQQYPLENTMLLHEIDIRRVRRC